MKEDIKDTIPVLEAAKWLARMAAKDGVVSSNERKLLKEFAEKYNLDHKYLFRSAHAVATGVDIPEVELITASKWKGRKFEEFIISLVSFKIMVAGIKLQQFHQLTLNFLETYVNMQSNKSKYLEVK